MAGEYKLLESKFLEARINKDVVAKDLLSVVKGEVENLTKDKNNKLSIDEIVTKVAKGIHKGLNNYLGMNTDEAMKLIGEKEIEILNLFLPKEMAEDELLSLLLGMDLDKLPNFGSRMGKAAKELKGKASGNAIKDAITQLTKDKEWK